MIYPVKPPLGTGINWSHPLAKGLVGCWVFNEKAGGKVFDMARKSDGTLVNSPTWKNYFGGAGINFLAASDQYIDITGNPTPLQITSNLSIATHYHLPNAISGVTIGRQLVAKDKNTGGRAYTLEIVEGIAPATDKGVRFYINGGGSTITNRATENRVPVTGDDRQVIATYQPGVKLNVYINGLLNCQNSGTADASINTATADVYIARRSYTGYTNPFNGIIKYVYIWNRTLTPNEVYQLYTNPYCFFQPIENLILNLTASSGWTHNIMGIANANIGKINGVSKANIAKVLGT